ncbi:MAG: rRNA (cytidine-2'-O-)-methyltransferase, partial [Deltaproteobacteria bacterium]|nr:rRNA (cytidine-2'-O-)-methyltransferase [Deltaproteobacteria bacterium]
ALSVAGLPTESFIFVGFWPKKKTKRLRQLNQLAGEPRTIIFYESPKRILTLLAEIKKTMGNRSGVLAREMTKLHEEFIRGRLTDILKAIEQRASIKGECTLLVAGCETDPHPSWEAVQEKIKAAVITRQNSLSAIAKKLAAKSGIAKNKIYAEALKISKEHDNES